MVLPSTGIGVEGEDDELSFKHAGQVRNSCGNPSSGCPVNSGIYSQRTHEKAQSEKFRLENDTSVH